MDAIAATHAGAEPGGEWGLLLLAEAIEQLSLARTAPDVAAVLVAAGRRLTGADAVAFVVREDETCRCLDEASDVPLWKGRSLPAAACISGWTMLNGEAAVVPDVYRDGRIRPDDYRPTFVKSLVMAPVGPAPAPAAVGAYWTQPRKPSAAEVARLTAIARAAASALETSGVIASLEQTLQQRDAVIRELDHRVRNNLAAARAIARQTLRGAAQPQDIGAALDGRLMALARAHELIQGVSGRRARLRDLVEAALAPHVHPQDGPVSISGPPVDLAGELAVNVHLALHELADNAVRHGALSTPEGRIAVDWRIRDGRLELTWRERGGPPASAPGRGGFGLRMVRDGLPRSLGGTTELAFEPEGLSVAISAPLSAAIVAV
jgi:two-component sensor histidine kinase